MVQTTGRSAALFLPEGIDAGRGFCTPTAPCSKTAKRNPYIVPSTHRTSTMENIIVTGVRGLPLIRAGDNIAAMICERVTVEDGDIISFSIDGVFKIEGLYKTSC